MACLREFDRLEDGDCGFLIPIFQQDADSNHQYTQTILPDGRIGTFREYEAPAYRTLVATTSIEVEIGDQAIWGFQAPDGEIIFGPHATVSPLLADFLTGGRLKAHPLAAAEVAAFLGSESDYPDVMQAAFRALAAISWKSAESWRDSVVLLPLIRRDFAEALSLQADDIDRLAQMVVVTHGGTTHIFHPFETTIPSEIPRWRAVAKIFDVSSLQFSRIGNPIAGARDVPIVDVPVSLFPAVKVIFTDPSMTDIADFLHRRAPELEVVQPYLNRYSEPVSASHALILLVHSQHAKLDLTNLDLRAAHRFVGVSIGSKKRPKAAVSKKPIDFLKTIPSVAIYAEKGVRSDHGTRSLARQLAELAYLLPVDAWGLRGLDLPTHSLYCRATGSGFDPYTDAFANLFELARSHDALPTRATIYDSAGAANTNKPASYRLLTNSFSQCDLIIPKAWPAGSQGAIGGLFEIQNQRTVPISPLRPTEAMLAAMGWMTERPVYQGVPEKDISITSRNFKLRVSIELFTSGRIQGQIALGNVTVLLLSDFATASIVTRELQNSGRLCVTARDLAKFTPDALSIWPLIAHQLHRLAISHPTKARSDYYLMIIRSVLLQEKLSRLRVIWEAHRHLLENSTIICRSITQSMSDYVAIFLVWPTGEAISSPAHLRFYITFREDRADCSLV